LRRRWPESRRWKEDWPWQAAEVVRAGLVGPRLSARIADQKGACHMTYRVIQAFLADVL
jgi:hypothetical protein